MARARRRVRVVSLSRRIAAVGLAFGALLALGISAAGPARAANETPPPYQAGQHLYDNAGLFSPKSAALAESLAAHIESQGGGRVAIYIAAKTASWPNPETIASQWFIDGFLITAQNESGSSKMGATLKAKLTKEQQETVDTSSGMSTVESWTLASLARIDGQLAGNHVFDGTGLLDTAAKSKAETWAKTLGDQIGGAVYVDIALGGDSPSSTCFFNGAHLSGHFGDKALVIALCASGGVVGGYISEDGLWDTYHTLAPWTSNTLSDTTATGDTAAYLQTLMDDVKGGSEFSANFWSDAGPWIIFAIVIVILSIALPLAFGSKIMRKLTGLPAPIKGGLSTSAVIVSIADTGITVSMPSVGPDAPEYKLGLLVTPPGAGGSPYQVEVKALIPRIFVPMIVLGATVGVLVDPANPMNVQVDFDNFSRPATVASPFTPQPMDQAFVGGQPMGQTFVGAPPSSFGLPANAATMPLTFDAAGNPNMSQVAAFASAVTAGQMPTQHGSAAQLLATGTHGTAVITSAIPLGKKVRDVNPTADFMTLDDPLWMFTVEVSLAGQSPFPAVFGHRVPRDKAGLIGPGTKLAVAVNPADKNQEVAIDWNQSPMSSY